MIELSGQHNHAPDAVDVEVRKLRKRGYEESLSSTKSSQSVVATALAEVPMLVKAEMPFRTIIFTYSCMYVHVITKHNFQPYRNMVEN